MPRVKLASATFKAVLCVSLASHALVSVRWHSRSEIESRRRLFTPLPRNPFCVAGTIVLAGSPRTRRTPRGRHFVCGAEGGSRRRTVRGSCTGSQMKAPGVHERDLTRCRHVVVSRVLSSSLVRLPHSIFCFFLRNGFPMGSRLVCRST